MTGLVSLIICTRNRSKKLASTLDTIRGLDRSFPAELIIVDNGSTDSTRDVLLRHRRDLALTIVTETRPGLARARNTGWRASRGDVVAFTDDDCYPSADLVVAVARSFDEDMARGFVGGRVLLHDPAAARITIQEKQASEDFLPGAFLRAGVIHGANFAFRRTTLEAVGGFDERLGAGTTFSSGEDIEILARILSLGWSGFYDPRIVVSHDHGRSEMSVVSELARQYDRGRGAYYAKCIANPKLRTTYAKHWYWAIRSQPVRTTVRELAAAGKFVLRSPWSSSGIVAGRPAKRRGSDQLQAVAREADSFNSAFTHPDSARGANANASASYGHESTASLGEKGDAIS